jgi:cell division protein FtsB
MFRKKISELLYCNRRRIATVAVAALACIVGYHAVFGANGMVVYHKKRAEYRAQQQQFEELQKQNDRLAQENRGLKTDPAAIEREARQQLHYTKPGEVVLVPPPSSAPQSEQPKTAQK